MIKTERKICKNIFYTFIERLYIFNKDERYHITKAQFNDIIVSLNTTIKDIRVNNITKSEKITNYNFIFNIYKIDKDTSLGDVDYDGIKKFIIDRVSYFNSKKIKGEIVIHYIDNDLSDLVNNLSQDIKIELSCKAKLLSYPSRYNIDMSPILFGHLGIVTMEEGNNLDVSEDNPSIYHYDDKYNMKYLNHISYSDDSRGLYARLYNIDIAITSNELSLQDYKKIISNILERFKGLREPYIAHKYIVVTTNDEILKLMIDEYSSWYLNVAMFNLRYDYEV